MKDFLKAEVQTPFLGIQEYEAMPQQSLIKVKKTTNKQTTKKNLHFLSTCYVQDTVTKNLKPSPHNSSTGQYLHFFR